MANYRFFSRDFLIVLFTIHDYTHLLMYFPCRNAISDFGKCCSNMCHNKTGETRVESKLQDILSQFQIDFVHKRGITCS
jgi:hypothetical protein